MADHPVYGSYDMDAEDDYKSGVDRLASDDKWKRREFQPSDAYIPIAYFEKYSLTEADLKSGHHMASNTNFVPVLFFTKKGS